MPQKYDINSKYFAVEAPPPSPSPKSPVTYFRYVYALREGTVRDLFVYL